MAKMMGCQWVVTEVALMAEVGKTMRCQWVVTEVALMAEVEEMVRCQWVVTKVALMAEVEEMVRCQVAAARGRPGAPPHLVVCQGAGHDPREGRCRARCQGKQ